MKLFNTSFLTLYYPVFSLLLKPTHHMTIFAWSIETLQKEPNKNICMYVYLLLNKNTPGVKKSEAKSEASVSSYSYTRLKSVISGRGQGPNCLLAAM